MASRLLAIATILLVIVGTVAILAAAGVIGSDCVYSAELGYRCG